MLLAGRFSNIRLPSTSSCTPPRHATSCARSLTYNGTSMVVSPSLRYIAMVIERHSQQQLNIEKHRPPSLELQLEDSTLAVLSKEIAQQTQRLRQMKGEELQELKLEELIELEELLEAGLCSVAEEKGERLRGEIINLQRKGDLLREENEKLRKEMEKISEARPLLLQGLSTESITNNICSSLDINKGHDSSDTSLKLGLPFPN